MPLYFFIVKINKTKTYKIMKVKEVTTKGKSKPIQYKEIGDIKEVINEETQEELEKEVKEEEVFSKTDEEVSLLKESVEILKKELEILKSSKETNTGQPIIIKAEEREKFGSAGKREIPIEDRLKTPKVYISRGQGFFLSVYKKDAVDIYPPYNRSIEFRYQNADTRTGKAEDVIYISVFKTYSKKEAEYVENSPYFNTTIFDSFTKAMEVNQSLVTSIESAGSYISMLTEDQVLGMANQYKLDTSKSVTELKNILRAVKLQEIIEEQDMFKTKTHQRVAANIDQR